MKRCKHENADHLMPGELFALDMPHVPPWPVKVEQFRCLDCGEWLSLGEANDNDPNVKVEIRAAEIAALYVSKSGRLGLTGDFDEVDGWCSLHGDKTAELLGVGDDSSIRAGYLAAAIAAHDKEQA